MRRGRLKSHSGLACLRFPEPRIRRLFLDVSVISKHDAGTGIQRMVRSVAIQLLSAPPVGIEVVPVTATRKRPYYSISWSNGKFVAKSTSASKVPIQAEPGDIFLGLDFALDTIRIHQRQLLAFRRQGGQLWFAMYDLLPVQRPDWFSDALVVRFNKWLAILAKIADGIYCISPTVERDLRDQIFLRYGLPTDAIRTHVLPLGGDISLGHTPTIEETDFNSSLATQVALRTGPTALMVGTLEPRKGYSDVLAAFELLWRRKQDINLVIVGRPGWKTESLQTYIKTHAEYGRRLLWLSNANDSVLCYLYAASTGVIAASLAEGYGLPVIEALSYGKPVLARDIPVFRMHEKYGNVEYFPESSSPEVLADKVVKLLMSSPVRQCVVRPPSWCETVQAMLSALNIS